MKLTARKEECCGCGACAEICPAKAIRMVRDGEGFSYPQIDGQACVNCGRCRAVCPVQNHGAEGRERLCFGVQAKDRETRYASSSGGVFPVLAAWVLRRSGAVFGAAWNERMEVVHREVRSPEELETVKKTKYVQSDLTGIYRRVRECLEEGRWVLFCGTPCQAQGLRLFLGEPWEKLVTVDLVCYGVPSPGIWNAYADDLERKHRGPLTGFSFRDKRNRDNGHACSYRIGDREFAESLYGNGYCQLYFAGLTVRPSCYDCKFCTTDRNSDFTIGDFWGIENVRPGLDDGMGTSMVIVHTEQGRRIWEEVKEELSWFPCGEKDLLQPRLTGPTPKPRGRGFFMALYRLLPFSLFLPLVRKLLPVFARRGERRS